MDTSLAFTSKAVAAAPYVAHRDPPMDTKVPIVKGMDGTATLPADKPFVAQVVTARLSGTEFPEQPGEIVPADRMLRPYSTPMLPYTDDADSRQTTEASSSGNTNTPQDALSEAATDTTQPDATA